nr:hypothetical protein [Tanacetum cinerariifolium]
MKHKKGTDEEADSFDDQLDTLDEVKDSSDEEVESTDEEEDTSDEDYELKLKKESNSKGSKAKSNRSKFKIISYKDVWENTDWKRKSPFYFSSDEESGDANTKGVNDKAESSQATPKAQSFQAKALRPNVIVRLANQYKNLEKNYVEKKFGIRTATEGSKSKGKRRVGGYESEKYFDAKDAAGTNHSDWKLVKRGITRLYKFRTEYGKPGGIKIKKKMDKESRNKLWDEITQYLNVDLIVRKLVMHRLGQLLRNFRMKLTEKYILPNLNSPLKLNELLAKYSAIVKAEEWVEFVNYTTTDAYKYKSTRGKMAHFKNVYHHKMGRGGYVFVKEKMTKNKEIKADEEPSHGIMWLKGRVNKDREFLDDEIRSVGDKLKEADDKINQATDERIELLQTQLDNERSVRQQKDSTDESVGCTRGAVEFVILIVSSLRLTPMAINNIDSSAYEVDRTKSSVVVRDKDARIQKKSNGLVTSEKVMETMEPIKTAGPKKTPKLRRNGSPDSQSQGNVSPTQELPTIFNDSIGSFFAWPKNQVVLDEEVTPPTTIQKISDNNSAPKLQAKRKNHVSRETIQRQARTAKSQ